MRKHPPEQLTTLHDLLQQAEHYSETSMSSERGAVPLTLMVLSPEGLLVHATNQSDTNEQKDHFAKVARIAAVAYKATAVAVVAETWIAGLDDRAGDEMTNLANPSESPDRREAVMIMGESLGTTLTRFLFIQRDSSGKFIGFGTSLLPDMDGPADGRLSAFMPRQDITDQQALAARHLLQSMGIKVAQPGKGPQWN